MATTERLSSERRKSQRTSLSSSVTLFLIPSGRSYPARSVDVSEGGMFLYVPAATPAEVGQEVELRMDQPARSAVSALRQARIVRVDRQLMLKTGHLPVAVRFISPGQ